MKNNTPFSLQPMLVLMLLAFSPLSVSAAGPIASGAMPNAGSLLQQVQPPALPPPSPNETNLSVETEPAGQLPPSAPFLVKALRLTGNTVFDTATLLALMGPVEGSRFTLAELQARVARITEYYHSHGYPLAQAIIPAQVLSNGVVAIDVIEARYGKIKLDNSSRVRDTLLRNSLGTLESGQIIDQAGLEHQLLLLSDVPGAALNATLMPGEATGTSDLLLTITPGALIAAYATLDDNGNLYTGRTRLSGAVNVNNSLGYGDVLSLNVLSSGLAMNYARLGYDFLLNGQGMRLGASYSGLHYILGDSLAPLLVHGTAKVASVWLKQPLLRRRDSNLYGQVQYDHVQLRDHIDASGLQTDRHLENWSASLNGDVRNALLAGGVSTWSLGWTVGRVGFDDEAAEFADAQTAQTASSFSKWNLGVTHLQQVDAQYGLYALLAMQKANTNLDSSQKISAGGAGTVRAYDTNAVSGDAGYLGTLELRRQLGTAWGGQWQALAFIDSARITVNQAPWAAGANVASLSGAGVGLNWSGGGNWIAKAYVAKPIGAQPVLVKAPGKTRLWLELNRIF